MTNKKIALVLNTAWNIYNFRLNLVKTILDQGYEVLLIAPQDKYVDRLEGLGRFIPLRHMRNTGTNPWQDFQLLRELKNIYTKEQPDVILHFTIKPNIYGGLAARSLDIPYICTVTGLGTFPLPSRLVNNMVEKLYKQSFKTAQKVIFQNKEDCQQFIGERLVEEEKCDLTPGSGVDVELFDSKDHIRDKRLQGKVVFAMIARLIIQKGVLEYVEAARQIRSQYPNTEFWLIGGLWEHPEAISKTDIEQWEAEDVVQYKGTTDDIKSVIADADVITLPSYYGEGVPRTLLESLAMSKPIITTDHKGCKEVVDEGKNGYLVPVRDVAALRDAFRQMIQLGKSARQDMGKHSRQKALNEFNDIIVIQTYLDEIERII